MLTPAQRRRANAMSERELQAKVRGLCADLGLMVQHYENSLEGRCWVRGDPDLRIYGAGVLYRELKNMHEVTTSAQRVFGAAVLRAGINWAVWRPEQLLDGTITAELMSIS